jgi:hypothetical protein
VICLSGIIKIIIVKKEGKKVDDIKIVVEREGSEYDDREVPEKEWLPGFVSSIKKIKRKEDWAEELEWYITLVGDFKDKKLRGLTSSRFIIGNKLHDWYTSLINSDLKEGEVISISKLLMSPCYVMVKNNKGNTKKGKEVTFQNITEIKHRVVESPVADVNSSSNSNSNDDKSVNIDANDVNLDDVNEEDIPF